MEFRRYIKLNSGAKALLLVLVISTFIALGISGSNERRNRKNELRANGVLLNCRITDATLFRKGPDFVFEFFYNGKKRSGASESAIGSSTYFIGQSFPLLYSAKSDAMQVLISPQDFNEFGIAFPDSLNWVLDFKKN